MKLKTTSLTLLLSFAAAVAVSQVTESTITVVTLQDVETQRSRAESAPGMSDSLRARILELYDTASSSRPGGSCSTS